MPRKLVLPAAGVTLTNGVGISMLADYFDIDSGSGIVMLGISAIGGWTYSLPPLNYLGKDEVNSIIHYLAQMCYRCMAKSF
ncbi:hypothetical protein DRO66_02245 [Candidatus Bathyarchaeota archaeon]|nr:MAG: hypothetical protein DRO66_02245 [Candidatus Bathyarchaeota archaeon]